MKKAKSIVSVITNINSANFSFGEYKRASAIQWSFKEGKKIEIHSSMIASRYSRV